MSEFRYLKSHEWAQQQDELVAVGVSDFAVEQLQREIVFVELPAVGKAVKQGEVFGNIEAVKAVSELYAPVSGTIEAVNKESEANPQLVADSPAADGWMIRIRPSEADELGKLMSQADYDTFVAGEGAH